LNVINDLRRKWFVAALSIAAAVFFTGALVFSALTYVSVMDARQTVTLANASETAKLLPNGSIALSLTIDLDNPSRQVLHITSAFWTVRVHNITSSGTTLIPVVSVPTVPIEYTEVGGHEVKTFEYERTIDDPELLSDLRGFINYSASVGVDYTLDSIEYLHDFRVVAWLGDYEHDYDYSREMYLNDMVKIERRYNGGEYN